MSEAIENHPSLYGIYKPNALIKAKGKVEMNLIEFRVYNEILAQNHKKEPTRLIYTIPVREVSLNKNVKSTEEFICKSLKQRRFVIEKRLIDALITDERFSEYKDAKYIDITPFPVIAFKEDNTFSVELTPLFKEILLKLDNNFTKGDIHTLRTFKHVVSNLMYWEIRRRQAFKQTWETTFDKMKEDLGMESKYPEFRDFRKKVLDIAQEELKDTWCSFSYEVVKSGQGGKVSSIKVLFKKGPEDEKSPAGKNSEKYPWEPLLLERGLLPDQVSLITSYISRKREIQLDSGKLICWDYDYIKISYQHAEIQFQQQLRSPNPVKDVGRWLFDGLMQGWWNDQVEAFRKQLIKEMQTELKF